MACAPPGQRAQALLEAVVAVGSNLDLETVLRRIVEAATGLVGARYGALGIVGERGSLAEFIPVGLDEAEIARIHHWPEGRGLLGELITHPRSLRLAEISADPRSSGFPAGHPPMRSFLGVPVRIRDEVYGNLYLTEKRGGDQFDEEDEAVTVALAAAAGVAIENARLYQESRRRQRWLQASAEVSRRLLSGTDPGEVLDLVTQQVLEMSGADLAVLALPDEERRELSDHACGRPGRGEDPGADASRGVALRGGAGERRASVAGRLQPRRAGGAGGPGADVARPRGGIPARHAGQYPRRAHGRPPPGGDAAGTGRDRAGRLLRGPGRHCA